MSQSVQMSNFGSNEEKFLEEATSINEIIDSTIKKNIDEMKGFYGRILASTSTETETEFNEKINSLAFSTKDSLIKIKDRIKKIERDNASLTANNGDTNLRRQQHRRLHEKFTEVLNHYQTVEKDYKQNQKDRVTRQYRIVNPDATQQEIDSYIENSSDQPVFQTALLRSNEARMAAAEVQKRHNEIKRIEESIAELAELTTQMALTVEMSDEVIVKIEEDAEDTRKKLDVGNTQLKKGEEHARAARRKKWITAAIILAVVAVLVILLVVFLQRNKNNNNN